MGIPLFSLLCKEDKQEAAERMNKAYQEFKQVLFQKLHVQDGQDLNPIGIVRELPSEGYKDLMMSCWRRSNTQ